MEEKVIKTKFTVASEEGVGVYRELAGKSIWQKYGAVVKAATIELHLDAQLNWERIVSELNTFSNQLVVVYVDDQPAGYAFLKGSGHTPEVLKNKRNICIAEFEVLDEYLAGKAKTVLLEKCLNICKSYEAIWFCEQDNQQEMIQLFTAYGFYREGSGTIMSTSFGLPLAIYVKINELTKK